MAYTRVNWQDLPSTNTPRNATNLNKMDAGIKENDDKLSGAKGIENTIYANDFKCKNLISGFIPNWLYNWNNNTWEASTSFGTSNFINVEQNTYYVFSHSMNQVGGAVVCFDGSETFVEVINQDTITTPFRITNSNVKKIRIVVYDSGGNVEQNETWMQLEIGQTASGYVPYKNYNTNEAIDSKYYAGFVAAGQTYSMQLPKIIGILSCYVTAPMTEITKVYATSIINGWVANYSVINDVAYVAGSGSANINITTNNGLVYLNIENTGSVTLEYRIGYINLAKSVSDI